MRTRPLVILQVLVLLACSLVVLGGCGREEGPAPSTEASDPGAQVEVEDEGDESQGDAEQEASPAARAAGAGLDRLAAAYAPVSDRINFLVTAETLRADAVRSGADDELERERAGVVRIEVRRMQQVLASARPRVAAVQVSTTAQQQVQQLLLEAIDARSRATRELVLALDASGRELADSLVEARYERWRDSWDASVRATREATTVTQLARTELGLVPAPEEALR